MFETRTSTLARASAEAWGPGRLVETELCEVMCVCRCGRNRGKEVLGSRVSGFGSGGGGYALSLQRGLSRFHTVLFPQVCSALTGAKESSSVLLEDASYGRVRQEFNPAWLWVALRVIGMCPYDFH